MDVAIELLGNAIDNGETETGSLADFFRGEEGFEYPVP